MIKRIFVFLCFLYILPVAEGQDENRFTGSLLWEISGKDLQKPSYILGTHHLIPVGFTDSIAGLKAVMETVDQVVGELLMSDQTAMQVKMLEAAKMPSGETYNRLLSQDDLNRLDEGLKRVIGAGIDQFGIFKPGFISSMYTVMFYMKIFPEFFAANHETIDGYIMRMAGENGKSVIALETVEDQIYALFDAEPLKDQAEALVCTVDHDDWNKVMTHKLNRYYRNGQLKEIHNLAFHEPDDPCPVSQSQQNTLLKNRNNQWLEKIPGLMQKESNLIAVGALHLTGKDGLLYQLYQMGYTVKAVNN